LVDEQKKLGLGGREWGLVEREGSSNSLYSNPFVYYLSLMGMKIWEYASKIN
jgi:hypothetical protein